MADIRDAFPPVWGLYEPWTKFDLTQRRPGGILLRQPGKQWFPHTPTEMEVVLYQWIDTLRTNATTGQSRS